MLSSQYTRLTSLSNFLLSAGLKQNNPVCPVVRTNSDNLAVVIDRHSLNQFPAGVRLQQVIQVMKLSIAVQESVEVVVASTQRSAHNLPPIVDPTGNAERSAQSSEHHARSAKLKERFHPARLFVKRHACPLTDVVDGEHIVLVVLEGAKIDHVEHRSNRCARNWIFAVVRPHHTRFHS